MMHNQNLEKTSSSVSDTGFVAQFRIDSGLLIGRSSLMRAAAMPHMTAMHMYVRAPRSETSTPFLQLL
jgi:hypothetical protein